MVTLEKKHGLQTPTDTLLSLGLLSSPKFVGWNPVPIFETVLRGALQWMEIGHRLSTCLWSTYVHPRGWKTNQECHWTNIAWTNYWCHESAYKRRALSSCGAGLFSHRRSSKRWQGCVHSMIKRNISIRCVKWFRWNSMVRCRLMLRRLAQRWCSYLSTNFQFDVEWREMQEILTNHTTINKSDDCHCMLFTVWL